MEQKPSRQQSAVVYLRLASSRQADMQEIGLQREGCLRIAARFGLTVVREYVDFGRSADWEHQPELQRLVRELAAQRDAAFVVVWDFSRLACDLTQLDEVIIHIRACGAEIATMTGMDAAVRFVNQPESRN